MKIYLLWVESFPRKGILICTKMEKNELDTSMTSWKHCSLLLTVYATLLTASNFCLLDFPTVIQIKLLFHDTFITSIGKEVKTGVKYDCEFLENRDGAILC